MIFICLLLTGFSLPLSEDLLILIAGALVSICIPDHYLILFLTAYFGSLFSAWIAYWIGRRYGEALYTIKWFKNIINKERIKKLHTYYEKFGIFTFIIGRFFPGGIRNALFMTSGLGKMPFSIFILRDSLACLISVTLLFNLGYLFGIHYKTVIHWIETYDLFAIGFLAIAFATYIFYRSRFNKT